ncbi:hypothetical protein D3C73_1127550 [compost metagenome]
MYIGPGGKSGGIRCETGVSFGTVFIIKHLGFVFLHNKEACWSFLGMGRFVPTTRHRIHASDKPFVSDFFQGADILVLYIDDIDDLELHSVANNTQISFGNRIFSFE